MFYGADDFRPIAFSLRFFIGIVSVHRFVVSRLQRSDEGVPAPVPTAWIIAQNNARISLPHSYHLIMF